MLLGWRVVSDWNSWSTGDTGHINIVPIISIHTDTRFSVSAYNLDVIEEKRIRPTKEFGGKHSTFQYHTPAMKALTVRVLRMDHIHKYRGSLLGLQRHLSGMSWTDANDTINSFLLWCSEVWSCTHHDERHRCATGIGVYVITVLPPKYCRWTITFLSIPPAIGFTSLQVVPVSNIHGLHKSDQHAFTCYDFI